MEANRFRRVAAVVLVLAVGAGVVWTLAALNATNSAASALGPVGTAVFGFGGSTVGVGVLAVGAALLAVGALLLRRVMRAGRAPPTPRRR